MTAKRDALGSRDFWYDPPEVVGRMDNLYELFASVSARFATRTAVEVQRADHLDTVRYDELERMAAHVAALLLERGCRKGDRVALLAENDAHWCAAFLGILRLGALAVPLDTAYKPKQMATLLADCGARIVIASPRHLATAREAAALRELRAELLLLHGTAEDVTSLEEVIGSGREPPPIPSSPATADDPAVILYTSGTTADPKGVVLTHGNLLAEREAAFQVVKLDERDVVLSVLPLFHALAMLANLLLPFAVGARVVFLESVNTTELLRALRERGVSAFCCVPQFFYLIHEQVNREVASAGLVKRGLFRALLAVNGWLRYGLRINLGRVFFGRVHRMLGPRMRILVTGGSRFDPAIGRDLVRLGFDIQQAYGLTECSGAVGPALPGVEIRIQPREAAEDDEGNEAERDGEVLIGGGIVMPGYYNRPDANAVTLRDGWLHTGDLGFVDARGRLHITGRMKDVIVLASGKNIYPEEIEAHYLQAPLVKELCVLGLSRPGEPSEQRLHAVVVPDLELMRERRMVNMREQLRFEIEGLSVQVPSHKRILSYDVSVDDLPRTTTRKLKRFEIARRLAEQRAGDVEVKPPTLTGEEQAWLDDPHVERMMGLVGENVKPGTSLFPGANLELDLGLDSMERVELLTSLEHGVGVRVPEEVAQKIYTVRELIEALRTASASAGGGGEAAPAWDRLLREVPEDDPMLAGLRGTRWVLAPVLFAILRAGYLLARLLVRFRVSGLDRLPARAPFIISPNHQSYLDAFLLVSALPYRVARKLFFVGASEYFATPFMAWVAKQIHVVPIDPDSNLMRAMKAGAYGLRHDKVLLLFPEGERSIDGSVKKFKKGAAILSLHLGVPVVPVAMDGVFDVWPRNRPLQWRALLPNGNVRILMQMGPPLEPRALGGASPAGSSAIERQYAAVTERLRDSVSTMWGALRDER
jgi:long-chain acyl-CoA synthetase